MPHESALVLARALRDARARTDVASRFLVSCFGAFELDSVQPRFPDQVFSGRLSLRVGDRSVELIEVGSAHTSGDALVHVPSAAVVFTGDLLFIESHPIMWTGPIGNWIQACDQIIALGATTIVPGHGPITNVQGVLAVRDYLCFVSDCARECFEAGLGAWSAAILVGETFGSSTWSKWRDRERIVVTVAALFREWTADPSPPNVPDLFGAMARFGT